MFSPAGSARRSSIRPPQQNAKDSPVAGRSWLPGTPAPLTSHSSPGLSEHFRGRLAPTPKLSGKFIPDGSDPVLVSDFPQQLRNLAVEAQRSGAQGGIDGDSGISWLAFKNQIFVWSHLEHGSDCKVLSVPSGLRSPYSSAPDPKHGSSWLVRIVNRKVSTGNEFSLSQGGTSASLVICSRKSLAVAYWPDIFKDSPVVERDTDGDFSSSRRFSLSDDNKSNWKLRPAFIVSGSSGLGCVAIAACSNGDLWRFDCGVSEISRHRISREPEPRSRQQPLEAPDFNSESDPVQALCWLSRPNGDSRECLILTSKGIESWDVDMSRVGSLTKSWTFDVSDDAEDVMNTGGQKQVRLLDLQVVDGKTVVILVASLVMDRLSSSSYMQYSLMTYQYIGRTSGPAKCLTRKAPVQVVLPRATVEEESFLQSMQLRVGGKPSGSALILSGDGVATISHQLNGAVRLYQFDLAQDAGRVLDAAVLPSAGETGGGTWLVLTEKGGVCAIPEKAVLLGAQKFSDGLESTHRLSLGADAEASPETKLVHRAVQDEEAEALIARYFQIFVTSRQALGVVEKLQKAGAFETDGEMNIFARFSKSIVDTIAKQWASSALAGAAVIMGISSQLAEKQRRHELYLNFLAVSKCHEILQQQQRAALHTIMEHGEKLAAVSKLKDLYNTRQSENGSPAGSSSALWEMIQVAGERARRQNVMLMDREKVEVFFTRVSDLEDFFQCVEEHGQIIVEQGAPGKLQRLCEISDACTAPLAAAVRYRDSQGTWYPSAEGLTPWYCKPVVRSGLWRVASLIMSSQEVLDLQLNEKLMSSLEELTSVLLDNYAGALAAKIDRGEDYRSLQSEYWNRRDAIFTVLKQYARESADLAAEHGGEEQRLEVLRGRYGSLLPVARRHAAYQTLWDICIDLNDMHCLRVLMHESMGLKEGRFCNFVFEQFLKKGQQGKLLRLGEEFKEELASFLKGQKSLSWLHDIFLRRFSVASKSLHQLVHSNGEESSSITLAARRKLLYLAKLAALAAGTREGQEKALQIDADLGILAVQELAVELGVAENRQMLSPLQLVELCLSSDDRELLLKTVDVFALSGDVFRQGNKSLLKSLWLKLADQDYWTKMKEASDEEGWTEQQQYEALKTTTLFLASKLCYGGGSAFVIGLPFEATLPAFITDEKDSSVEEVLMQHQDFAAAGEVMLSAVRMGAGIQPEPASPMLFADGDDDMEL